MTFDTLQSIPVQDIPKGEFVRRKADAKKTYTKGSYCKFSKAWELHDESDISRSIFVKKNTILFVGFEY